MEGTMFKGDTFENLDQIASEHLADLKSMRRVWDAIVHCGRRTSPSMCRARIYSDGKRAVVCLTELEANPGVSVTNDYERIAMQVLAGVRQFISEENVVDGRTWLERITWLEQYEAR